MAREVGFPWSPAEIVRRLQRIDPELFAALRPQRISQWRDHMYPNELKWTESHQRAIEAGSQVIKHGRRKGIFVCLLLSELEYFMVINKTYKHFSTTIQMLSIQFDRVSQTSGKQVSG